MSARLTPGQTVPSLLPRQVQAEVTGPTHEERVVELAERLAKLDAERAALSLTSSDEVSRQQERRDANLGNESLVFRMRT